jgi:hypothetical protein
MFQCRAGFASQVPSVRAIRPKRLVTLAALDVAV